MAALVLPDTREAMLRSLKAYLENGFQSYGLDIPVGRKIVNWDKCERYPSLFLVQKHEIAKNVGQLITNTMFMDMVLYARLDPSQTDITPAVITNPIVDVLFAILAPTPAGERQLLVDVNGVQQAYDLSIEGTIETDEGLLGDQGVVVIPLTIILP